MGTARSPHRFPAAQALQGLRDPEKKTQLLAALAKPRVVRSPAPEPLTSLLPLSLR